MGFIGEYTLRLYCDCTDCDSPHNVNYCMSFRGADRADCMKQARDRGWSIGLRAVTGYARGFGRSLCPLHSGKRKKKC